MGTPLCTVLVLVALSVPVDARAVESAGIGATSSTGTGFAKISSSVADTVGSSRVDLQACKLEYSIVSPK